MSDGQWASPRCSLRLGPEIQSSHEPFNLSCMQLSCSLKQEKHGGQYYQPDRRQTSGHASDSQGRAEVVRKTDLPCYYMLSHELGPNLHMKRHYLSLFPVAEET